MRRHCCSWDCLLLEARDGERRGQIAIKLGPGDNHSSSYSLPPNPEAGKSWAQCRKGHVGWPSFPESSGVWLTCVVHVGTTGAMPGAEAGGARVAVLGLGASGAQAADLTVGAIHHLHKLSAPVEGAEQQCSGPGPGCSFLQPAEGLGLRT